LRSLSLSVWKSKNLLTKKALTNDSGNYPWIMMGHGEKRRHCFLRLTIMGRRKIR
jgi:hypothetical protein